MDGSHLFELVIAMFVAIIGLHFVSRRLGLPPSVALLTGGAALAFVPGLPAITMDPELVLVIFLPPLLLDGAWSIAVTRLRRHLFGVFSLAAGAVFFTCGVVAVAAHVMLPSLPWAACAALGAIVSPPDAISARAVLERVTLPRRLQVLLEGESLLNDASGLVLFRFAVAAVATGTFSAPAAIGGFLALAIGGIVVGSVVGYAWVKFVQRLGDDYLVIASTALLSWVSYLLGEALHVSGVIATVTTGLILTWHQHTVMSAAMRMRGTSFWTVVVFLMEATVFVLIGLSLREVVERGGGLEMVSATMAGPALVIFLTLLLARFAWVFGCEGVIKLFNTLGLAKTRPLGFGGSIVLSWAGIRGVVTLALALSLPENFPGRDFILIISFAVILGTVLVQGTTLGRIIGWAKLSEHESERPPLTMRQAEAEMAQAQLETIRALAYAEDGTVVHPQLLARYERRAAATLEYAARPEEHSTALHAHFDAVLRAVGAGRQKLIGLHRAGEIDEEILRELERDLDLEELSAISAKA